jgi:hypothetical protein
MIIFNNTGLLMVFAAGVVGLLLVLVGVPMRSAIALGGTLLFIEDVVYRVVRYNPADDKLLSALHWGAGGSFFFIPVWLCALALRVNGILGWNIYITGGAVLCLADIALRVRRAQLDKTPPLKALVDWRLGGLLWVIPLWVAGLVVIVVAAWLKPR